MEEPLKHFYSLLGFDRKKIREWAIGEKYLAVMNTGGNIGVCATLGTVMDDGLFRHGDPDISNPCHRIILNAYFNSICNYENIYDERRDIFDSIDFSQHRRIVMIGYFESLYRKFSEKNIALEVFDIQKESHILSDISVMERSLAGADSIILTGTTIFNNTFNDIISIAPAGCNIFLLGPSNILSAEMFRYRGIKVVFGSVFERNDSRVLEKIAEGSGTRGFLPYLHKVYIINKDYKNEIQ
ncbi:MAG: Rossmann-like domain-containing protein [Bacteroidota bacterium]